MRSSFLRWLLLLILGTAGAIWLPPDALRIVFGGFFLLMSVNVARQALARRRADGPGG